MLDAERPRRHVVVTRNTLKRRNHMKHSRIRTAALGAAAGVVALALAACGGSTAGGGETVDGPVDAATVSLPAPNLSFDPSASVSATDRLVWQMINATLWSVGLDGEVTPGLAEDAEFSDDFMSATITLRDAVFSDGSPITAADVVATWDHLKTAEGSTQASTLNRLASYEATSDTELALTFTRPFPSFPEVFSQGGLGIAPAASLEDTDTYYENPDVVSGAYTIAEGWSGNSLELTANPEYYGLQPIVQNLTVTVVEDANSAISQVQNGQIDYAGDLAPNFVTQLEGTAGLTIGQTTLAGFYDLRLNNASGPFSDVNVRQAANAALDREAIVAAIWGDRNEPLSGFWPQSMDGFSDRSTAQDLDAAQEFLAGTECESGCTVSLVYSDADFPFSGQLALMVQNQLAEIGITVELERVDGATVVDRLFAGDFDIVPGAMSSPVNIPDNLTSLALLSTGPLKAEFTQYASAEMDGYVGQVNSSLGADREAAAASIEELFEKDQHLLTLAPWVRLSVTTLPDGVFSLIGTTAVMGGLAE
jgi:peptide/nickel transport system substrate-binding protein